MEGIKEYWLDRYAVVKELEKIIMEDPAAFAEYARRLQIATPTLIKLLQGECPPEFRTWCKIKGFIKKNERVVSGSRYLKDQQTVKKTLDAL